MSHLVTIDPATGNVTDIGASVTHLDAIAFVHRPRLSILMMTNSVVVAWQAWESSFRLQQNTNLNTTNWVFNTSSVTVANGMRQVLITPVAGSTFFRLISP